MAKIEFRGAVLEYQESGESGEKRAAESLVFVHGSASDYRTWDKQAEFFGHEYRVLAYSRRFHWPNQEPTSSCVYSMSEHMHDLDALLHRLEIAPAHLVGHSYGAFVCLLLAMQRPHLVRSLVLIEPPVLSLFVSDPPTPMEVAKLFPKNPTSALSILSFVLKGVAPATLAFRSGALERGAEIFGRATLGKEAFEHLSEERRSQMRDNLPALKPRWREVAYLL